MSLIEAIVGPLGNLLDKIIPDPKERSRAKLELIALQGSQEMEALKAQLSAILAEAQSADPWTSRARPAFLYVMYLIILCALPMGLIAAFWPDVVPIPTQGAHFAYHWNGSTVAYVKKLDTGEIMSVF